MRGARDARRRVVGALGPSAAALALAAAGSGCGSSTRAATQTKVDAAINADLTSDTAANRTLFAEALRKAAAVTRPFLDELRALSPPASDRVVFARYLSGVAGQVDLLDALADGIDADDQAAIDGATTRLRQGKASVKGLAQGYGFKACGSGV